MRTIGVIAIVMITLSVVLVGCEATAKSGRLEPAWQTTASYEKVFQQTARPSQLRRRNWVPSLAAYEPCVVAHFGSYFDDEFVTTGDGDETFGWTLMDTAAICYSPARFVVNTLAVPISMIKDPPGVLTTTTLDKPAGASSNE